VVVVRLSRAKDRTARILFRIAAVYSNCIPAAIATWGMARVPRIIVKTYLVGAPASTRGTRDTKDARRVYESISDPTR
jgi:hypothetical protein